MQGKIDESYFGAKRWRRELVDFVARVYYCAKQGKNEFALCKIISMESKKILVLCKA